MMNTQYNPAKLETINKLTVLKEVRQNGKADIWIAPYKVASSHIANGWRLGMKITIHLVEELDHSQGYYVFGYDDTGIRRANKLDDYLESFIRNNGNSQLGYRVRFWKEVK